jgi:uncharacterized RmlC-like cupin family protein
MPSASDAVWRIVPLSEAEVEQLPGKTHFWHCKPGMVKDTNLMFVRAQLPPGEAHRFHYHPHMEEILYILSGTAEHATYNAGPDTLDFLAILSPAKTPPPVTIEVADQEPWKSTRK